MTSSANTVSTPQALPVLQAQGLRKAFGGVQAVAGVDLTVHAGEMLALIGPNGAGKSTVFNLLNGQLAPDAGQVRVLEHDVTGLPPRAIWRLGVGRTFQMADTFTSLSVVENVQTALLAADGRSWSVSRRATRYRRADALWLLAQVGLAAQAEHATRSLAYADLKRLELALALAHRPAVLLMDEPTAGMAHAERHALMSLAQRLVEERQLAVLFTEHSMDMVFTFADRVMVLAEGRVMADGSPAEVQASPQVRAVYLGGLSVGSDQLLQPSAARGADSAPRQARPLLQVSGLRAWYGQAQALFGLSFVVNTGEVVALVGPNGAGKSTTLKALMGLLPAEGGRAQGEAHFDGTPLLGLAAHQAARLGLGYAPEDRRVFADLTVMENLGVGRKPMRAGTHPSPWTPERLFDLFPNLGRMRQRKAAQMSGGEQQMLSIARTLMGNPRLLLLDEPSEGIAPVIVEQLAAAIARLKAEGVSVLLSEQNPALVDAVADRRYALLDGSVSPPQA
jgi:branched-chain amino acid transport system ATP-binding protein